MVRTTAAATATTRTTLGGQEILARPDREEDHRGGDNCGDNQVLAGEGSEHTSSLVLPDRGDDEAAVGFPDVSAAVLAGKCRVKIRNHLVATQIAGRFERL